MVKYLENCTHFRATLAFGIKVRVFLYLVA